MQSRCAAWSRQILRKLFLHAPPSTPYIALLWLNAEGPKWPVLPFLQNELLHSVYFLTLLHVTAQGWLNPHSMHSTGSITCWEFIIMGACPCIALQPGPNSNIAVPYVTLKCKSRLTALWGPRYGLSPTYTHTYMHTYIHTYIHVL